MQLFWKKTLFLKGTSFENQLSCSSSQKNNFSEEVEDLKKKLFQKSSGSEEIATRKKYRCVELVIEKPASKK